MATICVRTGIAPAALEASDPAVLEELVEVLELQDTTAREAATEARLSGMVAELRRGR